MTDREERMYEELKNDPATRQARLDALQEEYDEIIRRRNAILDAIIRDAN